MQGTVNFSHPHPFDREQSVETDRNSFCEQYSATV
jgi:hypothetical protein